MLLMELYRKRGLVLGMVAGLLFVPLTSEAEDAGSPSESQITRKRASFVTQDNIVIVGSYTPAVVKDDEKAPIAILLHMYKQDRSTYKPLVPYLHRAGFAVLAIDMRGHGESAGPPEMKLTDRVAQRDTRLFQRMHRDVAAAYLWLVDQPNTDPARFVLVGASIGCSIALEYATRDRSVDGVVCMTPGTNYLGVDSIAHAHKYGVRPLLLLASADERDAAEELGKIVTSATVRIVPGGGPDRQVLHGTRMFGKVAGIEQGITDFLVKAAGSPAKEPVVASVNSDVYHQPDSGTVRRISKKNLRWFSSATEAETRSLRPPKRRSKNK